MSVAFGQHSVFDDAMVHARSALAMAATVSQNRLTPGATVPVRVRLSQYESVARHEN
jgi:hypothetical protein